MHTKGMNLQLLYWGVGGLLFPPSISYRTLGLHFCISDVDIFSCDYFKGCELNLLLEIRFINARLVLNSFLMTTPKVFLHEMVGWYHRFSGHESEQALGVGDGQGSLACCSPWGCRVGHDGATVN